MDEITDDDIRKTKQKIKEHYCEETGHELPDHVVENLEHLSPTSLVDFAEVEKRNELAMKELEDDTITTPELLFFLGHLAVSGLVGLYASRFFSGWGVQVTGGVLITIMVYALTGLAIWWVDER